MKKQIPIMADHLKFSCYQYRSCHFINHYRTSIMQIDF